MAAIKHNILIEEGATFCRRIKVTYTDSSNVLVPLVLTGYTARGQLRKDFFEQTSVIADFVCTIENALQGTILIQIPATVTQSLLLDVDKSPLFDGTSDLITLGYYDIEVQSPSGFVTRVLQGLAQYSDEITR